MSRVSLDHLPLLDVPTFLAASKNLSYRSITLMRAKATAEVFVEHGISSTNLVERYQARPEAFRVVYGDLSDTGMEFVRMHYDPWLASSDRWKGEISFDRLKSALELRWTTFTEGRAA